MPYIVYGNFTAWSTRPMTYLLFWTSQMSNSLEACETTGRVGVIIGWQRQLFVAYGECLRRSQDADDTEDAGVLR